ncbi:MAG TPA: alpha-L-rhamnosidase N-terminal domain-containing protein, partial [Nitriliruptorales bacterium]
MAAPRRLRCERHVDPLGIDTLQPRLSWEVADDRRGAHQRAYELIVASSRDGAEHGVGDLWKTGRVDRSTCDAVYEGAPLGSRDRCWWRVRTWDADEIASPWSDTASFELGLVRPFGLPGYTDWQARSIRSGVRGTRLEGAPAPFLRRSLHIEGEVVRARLYVTALGLHETWINGQRVTDDLFRPGWTDYTTRLPYQTYDVTGLVQAGDNVIGAVLGDGWYCGHNAIGGGRQVYGERPALFAQLEVQVAGRDELVTVPTDPEWRTTTGPILSADNYQGEHHDARLELDGWCLPGYEDAAWEPVDWGPPPLAGLVATIAPPVRVTEELRPVATWESAPGVHVFDLGQNMVGHVRLR